jgi:cleavage and polyadenylation specificity factor subunit 3
MSAITVKQTKENEVTLEWDSSASNDMLADSTMALIAGLDRSPAFKRAFYSITSRYKCTNQR